MKKEENRSLVCGGTCVLLRLGVTLKPYDSVGECMKQQRTVRMHCRGLNMLK